MSGNNVNLPQSILVFCLLVPLAIFLGYLLAGPTDFSTIAFFFGLMALLGFPLMLRHYHFLLIVTLNSALVFALFPGQPPLGFIMAILSVFIVILNRTMLKKTGGISVSSVTLPLVFLAVIVLTTAFLTGGIGGQVFGGNQWGAKRYLTLIGAIFAYFAIVSQRIPREKVQLFTFLFFFSGITIAVSDLVYLAGPAFYGLYYIFPSQMASLQAMTQGTLDRFSGVTWASVALFFTMILRYGLRGIFDLTRPWRIIVVLAAVVCSTLGGFRSALILMFVVFFIQFFLEKLHKTILLPLMVMATILTFCFLIVFVDKMPLSVQRSISFLPIAVDSTAKADADGTLDWRLDMWRILLPDIPKYLLLGKGFSFSGTDLTLTQESIKRGRAQAYEETLVSGNYHNGILTTIIPFGVFGMIAFTWFSIAGFRALHRNYKYGDLEFKNVNTFLFTFFIARLIFFVVFYGQLDMDLAMFTGTVGLSISVNGGIASEKTVKAALEPSVRPSLVSAPAVARFIP